MEESTEVEAALRYPKNHDGNATSSYGLGTRRWGPFDVHMLTVLVLFVLAAIAAFSLHAATRFLLRLYRQRRPPGSSTDSASSPGIPLPPSSSSGRRLQKQQHKSLVDSLPTLVFSPGTKLAGGGDDAAECAICLTEFAEGDSVRLLPACNHGFHVACVERWLLSRSSCPTCRTACSPAPPPAPAPAPAPPPPLAEP